MKKPFLYLILATLPLFFLSCTKEGCTDSTAENYDADAKEDDGTCEYLEGCTDPDGTNYNSQAVVDDGSCNYIYGCMDQSAINFDPNATRDGGDCEYHGKVRFWTESTTQFQVTIDGSSTGLNSYYFPDYSPTDCSGDDNMIGIFEPGVYSALIEYDDFFTPDITVSVTITSGGCLLYKVD